MPLTPRVDVSRSRFASLDWFSSCLLPVLEGIAMHDQHDEHLEAHVDQAVVKSGFGQGQVTVAAVFDDPDAADRALAELHRRGFSDRDLSVVYRGEKARPHVSADDTEAGKGLLAGATVGGALGGIGTLLASLTALAVPGIGPLIAGGPIVAAIGGLLGGAAMGGFVGSLVGMGISREQAEEYEAAVREGGTFISLIAQDGEQADQLSGLLRSIGARAIQTYDRAL
jgi:hypothetical protein